MMSLPSKILLASHNKGKVAEFQALFAPMDIEIVGADTVDLPEPEETEDTFEGNALLKARHACQFAGLPALADDSGLTVNALNGAPGVYSARYAGPTRDFNAAMERLWNEVGDNPDKSAQFVAVLALVMPDGQEITTRGEIQGNLIYPPRGTEGFGYDPIFIPHGETHTFAELGKAGKAKYSHRVRAFKALQAKLNP